MNLIDKLNINYREAVDIVNPFYFWYSADKEIVPTFALGRMQPISFVNSERSAKVELSANPDNINIDENTLLSRDTLTIFNRDQIYTLSDIKQINFSKNLSTGCIEFNITCRTLTIGGTTNE